MNWVDWSQVNLLKNATTAKTPMTRTLHLVTVAGMFAIVLMVLSHDEIRNLYFKTYSSSEDYTAKTAVWNSYQLSMIFIQMSFIPMVWIQRVWLSYLLQYVIHTRMQEDVCHTKAACELHTALANRVIRSKVKQVRGRKICLCIQENITKYKVTKDFTDPCEIWVKINFVAPMVSISVKLWLLKKSKKKTL